MGFFHSVFNVIKKVAPIAIGYALTGTPIGAAVGGAVGSAARGGNLKQIIQGAGYGLTAGTGLTAASAGISAAQGLPVSGIGPVGPGGMTAGLNAAAGSVAGSLTGPLSTASKFSNVIQAASPLLTGGNQNSIPQARASQAVQTAAAKQQPLTQPSAMAAPAGLSALAGFSPMQQRSNLATQGVNQGLGASENAYYNNLVQRSLIGDKNQITGSVNDLLPIEQQYYNRMGINTGDTNKFLNAIRG